MKSRMMISVLIIALVAVVIGGSTMAWFTAKAELANDFQAGTVTITADEEYIVHCSTNVNPGDTKTKEIDICNTGTKEIKLRVRFEDGWRFGYSWLEPNMEAFCFSDWDWDDFVDYLDTLGSPATISVAGWIDGGDGWWYYDGTIPAGACIKVFVPVVFDGADMGNEWQRARYWVEIYFEAVQASHVASWPN